MHYFPNNKKNEKRLHKHQKIDMPVQRTGCTLVISRSSYTLHNNGRDGKKKNINIMIGACVLQVQILNSEGLSISNIRCPRSRAFRADEKKQIQHDTLLRLLHACSKGTTHAMRLIIQIVALSPKPRQWMFICMILVVWACFEQRPRFSPSQLV